VVILVRLRDYLRGCRVLITGGL